MARGFGAFLLVLLGCVAGIFLDAFIGFNPAGIVTLMITAAVATWVIVYYQKKNKEELEAEISLLKEKLDKPEQKDQAD